MSIDEIKNLNIKERLILIDTIWETLESEMRRRRLREGRGDNHPRGPACQGVGYPPERGLFEKPYDLIPDRYANNL